jgi:hypothetical protein
MKNFRGKLIYGDAPAEHTEINGLKATDDAATAQASPNPEVGGELPPERGSATAWGPEPSPSAGSAPTEQTEIEALKRYGWGDDEIAGMSPKQRRQFFQEATETGPSQPTAELATRQRNPSTSVGGAPRTRLPRNVSGKLIYGGLGVIFLFTIFRVVFEQRATPPVVVGWDGISNCSFMVSFDGKRRLLLSENHFARIEDPDQASSDGSWSFDGSTGRYTVTVYDEPVTYSVVAPGDGDNCMLIKGDLATADLTRSWFYLRADADDQSDYEPPER